MPKLDFFKAFRESNDIIEQNVAGYVLLGLAVYQTYHHATVPEWMYNGTLWGAVGLPSNRSSKSHCPFNTQPGQC